MGVADTQHAEYMRVRSAHWLQRLELLAALNWIGLAGAVLAPDSGLGTSPPPVGTLLALPYALYASPTREPSLVSSGV